MISWSVTPPYNKCPVLHSFSLASLVFLFSFPRILLFDLFVGQDSSLPDDFHFNKSTGLHLVRRKFW